MPDLENQTTVMAGTVMAGTDLDFHDVNFQLTSKNDEVKKQILLSVFGSLKANTTTAILGPSGSGKSSLLNILAGRQGPSDTLKITCSVTINGQAIDPIANRENVAYVMQDDSIDATVTPREALMFSAKLRCPDFDLSQKRSIVGNLLNSLGIEECADTFVGGELIKGISGGERKRTSIGVELITLPKVLFLDEPTSGLDSFSALGVVENLLELAVTGGTTVLCTIHQPSSEIFNLFQNVILMKSGRVVYSGSVKALPPYFESFGFSLPPHTNPADFVLSVIMRHTEAELEEIGLYQTPPPQKEQTTATSSTEAAELAPPQSQSQSQSQSQKVSFVTQLRVLSRREMRSYLRNKPAFIISVVLQVVLNLIFGVIFYQAAAEGYSTPDGIGNAAGAVTIISISALFGPAQAALFKIPAERPQFLREFSTGTYCSFAYFLSKLFVEIPSLLVTVLIGMCCNYWLIGYQGDFALMVATLWLMSAASSSLGVLLGCSVDNVDMAVQLFPLVAVPQILFSGVFLTVDSIPGWIRCKFPPNAFKNFNVNLLTIFCRVAMDLPP